MGDGSAHMVAHGRDLNIVVAVGALDRRQEAHIRYHNYIGPPGVEERVIGRGNRTSSLRIETQAVCVLRPPPLFPLW